MIGVGEGGRDLACSFSLTARGLRLPKGSTLPSPCPVRASGLRSPFRNIIQVTSCVHCWGGKQKQSMVKRSYLPLGTRKDAENQASVPLVPARPAQCWAHLHCIPKWMPGQVPWMFKGCHQHVSAQSVTHTAISAFNEEWFLWKLLTSRCTGTGAPLNVNPHRMRESHVGWVSGFPQWGGCSWAPVLGAYRRGACSPLLQLSLSSDTGVAFVAIFWHLVFIALCPSVI